MKIENLREVAFRELERVRNQKELNSFKVKYLGRKGSLTQFLRKLKELSLEERKTVGPIAQKLKRELEGAIEFKKKELEIEPSLEFDITRPGQKPKLGHLHPLTKVEAEMRRIFLAMNFSVVEGPELETEYYNFDALNIPPYHPARESWDTFWLKLPAAKSGKLARPDLLRKSGLGKGQKLLLRAHTSPMQIRYMETHQPPFQIVVPGRTFRYEATDSTHETTFNQMEGLMVGKDISLANFKFVVEEFFRRFFSGQKIEFRYLPSYYPFVEPGLDVAIKLGAKWLEVMGAGMVHPHVFEAAHYNPRDYQGFAFGMGVDRLTMIKYKVPDIRLFRSGDLRFINQF
ncbi:MAG TPA: phenylalanine--tRNA ligase subunit alpha [Candidatus Paceibacterota bacterium]